MAQQEMTKAEVHALARGVAEHLDARDGWEYGPDQDDADGELLRWARIVRPDGAKVSIREHWRNRGRIVAGGVCPTNGRGHAYGFTRHEITVAVKRGAAVIAREIERRLLPAYIPDYLDVKRRYEDRERNDETGRALAYRLAEATGQTEHVRDGRDCWEFGLYGDEIYGDVQVHSGGRTALKLVGLTEAEVLNVLKAVGLLAEVQ